MSGNSETVNIGIVGLGARGSGSFGRRLADGVYGFFSEQGSHPGISTQSAARVCVHVLWAFGYYVLEKFQEWRKTHEF